MFHFILQVSKLLAVMSVFISFNAGALEPMPDYNLSAALSNPPPLGMAPMDRKFSILKLQTNRTLLVPKQENLTHVTHKTNVLGSERDTTIIDM